MAQKLKKKMMKMKMKKMKKKDIDVYVVVMKTKDWRCSATSVDTGNTVIAWVFCANQTCQRASCATFVRRPHRRRRANYWQHSSKRPKRPSRARCVTCCTRNCSRLLRRAAVCLEKSANYKKYVCCSVNNNNDDVLLLLLLILNLLFVAGDEAI